MDVGFIDNGDWVKVKGVAFGTGASSFTARVASAASGGRIELRLDSTSGPLVGTCTVAGTGGWQTWTTVSCPVNGATGTQDLYPAVHRRQRVPVQRQLVAVHRLSDIAHPRQGVSTMTHNPLSRRSFVKTLGAAGVVAAAGSAGVFPSRLRRRGDPRAGELLGHLGVGGPAPASAGMVPGRQVRHLLPLGRVQRAGVRQRVVPAQHVQQRLGREQPPQAVYGDPSVWPYHNFINGARDKAGNFVQFAPKLKSAGGNFDPDAWAQLFADAGAKFAGPVAEHHDGFSMWNSSVNEWNSVATGRSWTCCACTRTPSAPRA